MTVQDAARAWRSRPGFVLLESTVATDQSISLLAAEPELIIAGGPESWSRLEQELAARSRPASRSGHPEGAAIGWVGFDGHFQFGFYDEIQVFRHDSRPPSAGTGDGQSRPYIPFQPRMKKTDFLRMVEKAQDYIAAGDIYQVCLSHPFEASYPGSAWAYYEALRRHSPAPFSAFLNFDGMQIASASPECFLRMSDRRIITRPIKGTSRRQPDQQLDQHSARDLRNSQKEIAELIMITDLERNDLGRICEFGSVEVPDLLTLESYEQVHHLVSTVRGTLRSEITHPAALQACFPGGSISGAPKKRALEIIAELEPFPRGLYTGAIGYFGYNGESQFSIAIRTAVFQNQKAGFHVGAGIVADSVPEREWQETLDKAAGLLLAAGM